MEKAINQLHKVLLMVHLKTGKHTVVKNLSITILLRIVLRSSLFLILPLHGNEVVRKLQRFACRILSEETLINSLIHREIW